MGCSCTREQDKETVNCDALQKKTYSWDAKRASVTDPRNFIIENVDNHEEIRKPGSVNGQQFIIQNCKDSTIYVFDHINTITIDDCFNCKIVLGPVKGSVFVRNCKSCTCVVACGQFRMRDCAKVNVFLHSATQPIIESSRGIHFGNYQLRYRDIEDHFQRANLNGTSKNWKVVYDFTPVQYGNNWTLLKNDKITDYVRDPESETLRNDLRNLEHFWLCDGRSAGDSF